jgi:hypothetical protein
MRRNTILVAALFAFSASQTSSAAQCTQIEAYAAEVVTDYLDSWENVYQFFKQFQHCYEASIAEGAEDKIQLLWATKWPSVAQMIELTNNDPEFKTFIWQRITDETFPQDRFATVVRNAKEKCPLGASNFCSAIISAAAQPIIPPDLSRQAAPGR